MNELYLVVGIFLGAGFVITLEALDRSLGLVDWLTKRIDEWVERANER